MLKASLLAFSRSLINGVQPCFVSKSLHTSQRNLAEDYYKILGVTKNSTAKEIKQNYFNLAKKYHPDANPGNKDAATKFQKVSQAYEILGNSEKRRQYDMMGSDAYSQQGFQGAQGNPYGQQQWTYREIDPKEAEELFKQVFQNFNQGFGSSKSGGIFGSMMSRAMKGVFEEMMKPENVSRAKQHIEEFEIQHGPKGIKFIKKDKKSK